MTRREWDLALEDMAAAGVPLRTDREQAWRDWAGWRVNYDHILLALAGLVDAPVAPWTADRSVAFQRPRLFPHRHRRGGG